MIYSFDDAEAPERHDLQYFEMFGNRGIYYKGWSAVTKHRTPWELGAVTLAAFDDDIWELYDGSKDWTQADDLSAELPDKLRDLQRLWLIEAVKYNVLPIDDRTGERVNPACGRSSSTHQRHLSASLSRHETTLGEQRHQHQEQVVLRDGPAAAWVMTPAQGVLIAQGRCVRRLGALRTEGRAKFVYNVLGIQLFVTEATEPIPAGEHQVRVEFAYDGGGLAKGGIVTLYYDGQPSGEGRVEVTQPMVFSADETTDIGDDYGMPVSPDYAGRSKFNGKIDLVQIDIGDDNHDHLVDPADLDQGGDLTAVAVPEVPA